MAHERKAQLTINGRVVAEGEIGSKLDSFADFVNRNVHVIRSAPTGSTISFGIVEPDADENDETGDDPAHNDDEV